MVPTEKRGLPYLTEAVSPPHAIVVAVTEYEHHENLPVARGVASELAHDLNRQGYVLDGQDVVEGGDSHDLHRTIEVLLPPDARRGQTLLVYWTGHGSRDGDGHYLVCRNSPANGLSSANAVDAKTIGSAVVKTDADKVLIIVDTCYSGEGANEIAATISNILANIAEAPGRERAIAVIASTSSLERAREGVFCQALRQVLSTWSERDQVVHTEFLARSVRRHLGEQGQSASIRYKADGIGQDFIPNPRYRPNAVPENVEEHAWRLEHGEAEHFDTAARGIEVGESGWFFAGRKRLLGKLVDWLKDADSGLRIVTGPPGAGKSAVMGRLATLSDPAFRKTVAKAGMLPPVSEGTVPTEGVFDVAIHAKGKTLAQCARQLGEALRVDIGDEVSVDVDKLVEAIGALDRRVTIMLDALDEASAGEAQRIADQLIRPLSRLNGVRVLLGTRRSLDGLVIPHGEDRHQRLREAFGADAVIDDLEDEEDTDGDIADYVGLRLKASSRHRNKPAEEIRAAAERIAAKADGVFLYARIVSRTLQEIDRLDEELPDSALDAFVHDLHQRFGADRKRVDDLLGALAWGEGSGLTRRVWPAVANALAEQSYDDDDIAFVLSHAGWHIKESGEDGQAVYRLSHQALADHYRANVGEASAAQAKIVAALTDGVTGGAWLDSDRYLWRHLADHAVAAGSLGDLIQDPGYLAVAEPTRLVVLLPSIIDQEARRYADIYNRTADRLFGERPIDRLPLIHMTAQMEEPDLAPTLEPPVPTSWRVKWAKVRSSAPHRIIGRHMEGVNAIAFSEIGGRPVVVSGGADGTVRIWDARRGKAIGKTLKGHKDQVLTVGFGKVEGGTVVISAGRDGTIRLWDANSGEQIDQLLEGHSGSVRTVALGQKDGRPIVLSVGTDKMIATRDVHTGQLVGRLLDVPTPFVDAVAFAEIDGRSVVISPGPDDTICRQDALSGEIIGAPLKRHTAGITCFAVGDIDRSVVLASGSNDRTISIWDVRTGEMLSSSNVSSGFITCIAFGEIDRRPIVIDGRATGTINLWDAKSFRAVGSPLEGHSDGVTCVAFGEIDGRPTVISSSYDGAVRLWDLTSSVARHRPTMISSSYDGAVSLSDLLTGVARRSTKLHRSGGLVVASAFAEVDGRREVISAGANAAIRRWDAETGEPIGPPLLGHKRELRALTVGDIAGRPIAISGGADKGICVWDLVGGKAVGRPLEGHTGWVVALAFAKIDGRPTVISGSLDKTIRLWDAAKGAAVGRPLEGHDETVNAVAFAMIGERPTVVSGSLDRSIRRWDARTGEAIGRPLEGPSSVQSVAIGEIDNRPVLISGCGDGAIRLWDALSGEAIGRPIEGHASGVNAVISSEIGGGQVVISGGRYTLTMLESRMEHILAKIALPTSTRLLNLGGGAGVAVCLYTGVALIEFDSMTRGQK